MTPLVVNKVRVLLPFLLVVAGGALVLPARADDKLKPEDLVVFNLTNYSFTSPLDVAKFTFGREKK